MIIVLKQNAPEVRYASSATNCMGLQIKIQGQ